jgi:hypothetical protein
MMQLRLRSKSALSRQMRSVFPGGHHPGSVPDSGWGRLAIILGSGSHCAGSGSRMHWVVSLFVGQEYRAL